MGVIRFYVRMMPKIQARQSLLMAQRLGVGTGSLKKEDMKAIQRDWRSAADIRDPVTGKKARAVATPEALPAMGIGRIPSRAKK